MKVSISLATSFAVLFITGCTSVSTVSYPLADGRYHVQRTMSDPHAFSPTVQRSWLEICDKLVVEGDESYTNCSRDGLVQFATTNGYLDGLGSAALYSGAIVGGAALIGNGIAQSGTTVNQASGGAQAGASSGAQSSASNNNANINSNSATNSVRGAEHGHR